MRGAKSPKIYFVDEQYYLIENLRSEKTYIAVQAIEEENDFALQYSRVLDSDAIYLYNRRGVQTGQVDFESGQELAEFLDELSSFILAYNGQSVYFEPDEHLVLPDEYEIIP